MVDMKKKASVQRRPATAQDKPKTEKGSKFSGSMYKHGLLLFLLTFLVNANTLTLDYALDDSLLITQNKLTQKGISGIPEIWSSDVFLGYFGKKGIETGGRYRPMSQTFFALQLEFFGPKPVVGHFFNTLLYAITCLLLFLFLYHMFPPDEKKGVFYSLPFVAGLLYAFHPLHVEAVANIKSLDEILAMLFAVMSALFILQSFKTKQALNLVLGSAAFFFALASKENALTFLAVIPLALFYLKKDVKQIALVTVPLIVTTALYFVARSAALGPSPDIAWVDNFLTNPFFGATFMQKMATILLSWLKYLQLMVFPHPLTTDYYPAMIPVTGWSNPLVLLSFLFYTGIAVFALWKLPKRNIAAFGILYFFITFSVVSNLLINLGTPLNDRFLFMPLAGFCIAIAYLLTDRLPLLLKNPNQKSILAGLVIVLALGLGGKTFSRNMDWADDFTLFRHDIEISGNSARCNVMTGKTYYEKAPFVTDTVQKLEYLQKADQYLKQGLKIYDGYFLAWGILGIMEMDKKNYRQSLDYFVRCLKIEPKQGVALANLNFIGRKMAEKNDVEGCLMAFEQLKHFKPEQPDSYLVMAELNTKAGKVEAAMGELDALLKIDPKNGTAYRMKGELYAAILKDEVKAEENFQKALQFSPDDINVLDNLGVRAFRNNEFAKALEYFSKANSLNPNNAHLLLNIARTYNAMGNVPKAQEFLNLSKAAKGAKKQ